MNLREKDAELANDCQRLSDAASEARAWANDNIELLGNHYKDMTRSLKKQTVEARKLARAARRPMSVGLFGPSQHGKSFLSGRFLKPADPNVAEDFGRVRFGSGEQAETLDFLTQVNPQGGRETTGLVTRFTLSKVECPAGYPVRLRMMSEIDIVRILANSFVLDLGCDAVKPIDEARINAALEAAEAKAMAGGFEDNLKAEDIYELEDYFQQSLGKRHPIKDDLGSFFWSRVDQLLPALQLNDRADLFALLWGETPEFTQLYLELKAALDAVGHPDYAFVSLDAIRNLLPGETILHVETMKAGLAGKGGALETLVTADGRSAPLRKPVITALALEMTAQLEQAPWTFFENTDLLDFPGCRKRHDSDRAKYFGDPNEEHPVGEAFLRGKVAVMFDSYAADFDLNSLVACHRPEQNTTNFPDLIEAWIRRTHGEQPEDREGKSVSLFFAMTFCDRLLDESEGAGRRDVKLNNALNILEKINAISEWTPGTSFTNTFLIRNPAGKKLSEFFEIENLTPTSWREVRRTEEKLADIEDYKKALAKAEAGHRFFGDTDAKWDAMMTANDGGIGLLGRSLEEASNPDIKYDQIAPRQKELQETLSSALDVYYESGDLAQRVRERLAVIQEVVAVLDRRKNLVPRFITEFQPGVDMLRRVYVDYRRRDRFGSASNGSTMNSFGELVLEMWADMMGRKHGDDILCRAYGLENRLMQRVSEELERGAHLASMARAINGKVNEIENYSEDSGKNADRVGLTVSLLVGDFVSHLGCGGEVRLPSQPDVPLFERQATFDASGLPVFAAQREGMLPERDRFKGDWLKALLFMTEVNASSSEGSLIDIAQNERLGGILSLIDGRAAA